MEEEQKTLSNTEDGTKLGAIRKELAAWWEAFMNKPFRTIGIGLILVVLIGLGSIAPRAFNDGYSRLFPPVVENPFSNTQTIYSNVVPLAHDIINLDRAGTLTPSPYNLSFGITSNEVCAPTGLPLIEYSRGIVLVLNIAPVLSSQPQSGAVRGISFRPPPTSSYFTFEVGTTHEIHTSGRRFLVTLSRINDLTTEENGPYFSYVFDINEK